MLWLTESFSNGGIRINPHVQITLELLLRFLDQEEANLLRNSIPNISDYDIVVIVNS